jgi:hypothetical protein
MNEDRKIPDHVARLLASSIETVGRLDVLLHLRAARGKTFTARTVASACGITAAAAEQHLAILCGRGFLGVSIGSDLAYSYQPISPAIHQVLEEVQKLNATRRADVVAALAERRDGDPVHAFANAFLVRKGGTSGGGTHG